MITVTPEVFGLISEFHVFQTLVKEEKSHTTILNLHTQLGSIECPLHWFVKKKAIARVINIIQLCVAR